MGHEDPEFATCLDYHRKTCFKRKQRKINKQIIKTTKNLFLRKNVTGA
jgi:hypothetical protein